MFYYEQRRKKKKRIAIIALASAAVLAGAVLVFLNFDRISGLFRKKGGEAGKDPAASASASPLPQDLPPIVEEANTVGTRFTVPEGFERVSVAGGSFAEYLRNYELLPYGTAAKLYDGTDNAAAPMVGVLDQEVKNKVQQGPDALIRLYAEYKFERGAYDDIYFDFNNTPPFRCDYRTWLSGKRVKVEGSKAEWTDSSSATPNDTSYGTFRYYLQTVQQYANTDSLKTQLRKIAPEELQIGDVFLATSRDLGGADGQAIIVMDLCVNPKTGEKRFICAEGGTPATETYILVASDSDGDPDVWFSLDENLCLQKGGVTLPSEAVRRF